MISFIIPFYNEEKELIRNQSFYESLGRSSELIFSDGGSTDASAKIAVKFGKIISGEKGRAAQMNCGAREAKGNILFFLHADARISAETVDVIDKTICEYGAAGGCLTQRINKNGGVYRFIESFGNIRAKITKVFYGDQGIFVTKDIFRKIGGFPDVPIMEDVRFSRKLRKSGKTVVLPDKIFVSPRRWEEKGALKTIFLYSRINFLFFAGVPLEKIKEHYEDLR